MTPIHALTKKNPGAYGNIQGITTKKNDRIGSACVLNGKHPSIPMREKKKCADQNPANILLADRAERLFLPKHQGK